MQSQVASVLGYEDLRQAVQTINREIETLIETINNKLISNYKFTNPTFVSLLMDGLEKLFSP